MQLLDNREKNTNEFARLLGTFRAAELLGLARILHVHVFYEDVKDDKGHPMPRSGEAIIEDCLVKFYALNRSQRRDILKRMRAVQKENSYGTTTEH